MNDLFEFKPSPNAPKFKDFWSIYPRRVGTGRAEMEWNKAVKSGTHPEQIIAALRRQLNYFRSKEEKHIPHASTWIHQKRWLDDVQQPERPTETDFQRHQRQSMEALERAAYGDRHDEPSSDTIDLRNSDYRTI